jgi:ribosomal 50S subunit-recycling heat shock protein
MEKFSKAISELSTSYGLLEFLEMETSTGTRIYLQEGKITKISKFYHALFRVYPEYSKTPLLFRIDPSQVRWISTYIAAARNGSLKNGKVKIKNKSVTIFSDINQGDVILRLDDNEEKVDVLLDSNDSKTIYKAFDMFYIAYESGITAKSFS